MNNFSNLPQGYESYFHKALVDFEPVLNFLGNPHFYGAATLEYQKFSGALHAADSTAIYCTTGTHSFTLNEKYTPEEAAVELAAKFQEDVMSNSGKLWPELKTSQSSVLTPRLQNGPSWSNGIESCNFGSLYLAFRYRIKKL